MAVPSEMKKTARGAAMDAELTRPSSPWRPARGSVRFQARMRGRAGAGVFSPGTPNSVNDEAPPLTSVNDGAPARVFLSHVDRAERRAPAAVELEHCSSGQGQQ